MNTYPSSRLITRFLLILVAGLALQLSPDAQARTLRAPDTTESFGAYELVTRGNALAGRDYALRYRAVPIELVGKSGMFGHKTARYKTFNAVFTFAPNASGTPAILVNVGAPNNDSFFYLLRDIDGKAEAQYVGEANGVVTANWIDPPAAGVSNVWDASAHRGRLAGGRWVLVGKYTAIDMQHLQIYALARARTTDDPSPNEWMPVIAMSPDRLSFVRYGGFQRIVADRIKNEEVLIVTELTTERWYTVPIRRICRARTRPRDEQKNQSARAHPHHARWRRHGCAVTRCRNSRHDQSFRDRCQDSTLFVNASVRAGLTALAQATEHDQVRAYRLSDQYCVKTAVSHCSSCSNPSLHGGGRRGIYGVDSGWILNFWRPPAEGSVRLFSRGGVGVSEGCQGSFEDLVSRWFCAVVREPPTALIANDFLYSFMLKAPFYLGVASFYA